MKKLLIMASLFPPQKLGGGPITSVSNLVENLKDRYEIFVLSHNFDLGKTEPLDSVNRQEWNNFGAARVYYFDYKENRFGNVLRKIKEVEPDIIYQNSFFSYDQAIPAFWYKKFCDKKVRLVVAPRGEFGVEKFKIGNLKKKTYKFVLKCAGFLKNVLWQATADKERDEIKSFIKSENVFIASNLPSRYSKVEYSSNKEKGRLSLFTISRIHEIKNIFTSVLCLKNVKGDVAFDVYGPIEQEDYWKKCLESIKELPANIKVNYCGLIDHSKVGQVIAAHDVLLFPTRGENYGQTIVDSFLNARPVIISDMTPWSDCADFEGGFVVPLKETDGFTEAVQKFVDMGDKDFEIYSHGAKNYIEKKLNLDKEIAQYCEIFDSNE